MNPNQLHPPTQLPSRREFIKASAVGALLAGPYLLKGETKQEINSETLKVGLIGCGGRGTGAAEQALKADPNVVLTAMADVFEDRLQKSLKSLEHHSEIGAKVRVDPDHRFTGFDAYKKIMASSVDVVLLASPPGFRPQHFEAAVAAGKHVFCEKPMAVDAPGVRSILKSAEEARRKKLSVVAGYVSRYSAGERELIKRIHDGRMGDLVSLYNAYQTGSLWSFPRKAGWTDMEWQMRNWYYFTWLSGDHIVEQAVHNVDKMCWAMNDVPPLQATAQGGRQVRTDPLFGHIYDNFAVVYEYPNGVRGFHFCRQQEGCSNGLVDIYYGTKGTGKIVPFGTKEIRGENAWRYSGPQPNMYQVEHDELFASIRSGHPINDGTWMAHSTLVAIMGRMAAYTGQTITWDQAMNSRENLFPEKLDWNAPVSVPPVAIPGKTKFL